MKPQSHIRKNIPYREGDEVMLLIEEFTDLGIKVIIDGRYEGLLYRNEVYRKLSIGEQVEGYIKKVREDNRIDVTLRKGGFDDVMDARSVIIEKLKAQKGFLPLSDNSPPGLIKEELQMSKKLFKKAIGGLYKDGIIEIKQDGIYMRTK